MKEKKSNVDAGSIFDRNGVMLAENGADGKRKYAPQKAVRRAMCHLVGDSYGQTMGAETLFASYIYGLDQGFFDHVANAFMGKKNRGSDVTLTADSALCAYAYDLMEDYSGAVILMNYKTGEILASVSQPIFDPNYMADYISGDKELEDSAMVNRVTMGKYTPGSTFKTITLTAALRYLPNAQDWTFDCTGQLAFDKDTGRYLPGIVSDDESKHSYVRDSSGEVHGKITLEQAYQKSCNCAFAQLAMEIGPARLKKIALELGVGVDFSFADMMVYAGSFESGSRDIDIAWSGAGQYKNIVTPINMCMITAAVANGGAMMEPKLLCRVVNAKGNSTYTLKSKVYSNVFSGNEADIIREYMISVVGSGTGSRAAVSGYTVGGKTGTAQVSNDKSIGNTAWFTGFVYDDEHPLAICIVLEDAGSGGKLAAPIASKMFKKAISLGY